MVKKLKAATEGGRKVMILYLFSGLEPVLGPEVYWLKKRSAHLEEEGYAIIAKVCSINSFYSLWAHWGKGIAQAFWGMLDFTCGSAGKESACKAGDLGLIPGLGRFPGKGKGYPLQYSGVENSMNCIGSQRVGHDWATFTSQTQGWNWHRCQKQKKVILVSLLE